MNKCLDCEQARQVADKKRIDVVGCMALTMEEVSIRDVGGNIWAGYVYGGRRPGDSKEYPAEFSPNTLTLGYIVEADHWCKAFRRKLV